MSKILVFFLSLFCLGTLVLIPLGIVGLWYFFKTEKRNGFEMKQYNPNDLERFI